MSSSVRAKRVRPLPNVGRGHPRRTKKAVEAREVERNTFPNGVRSYERAFVRIMVSWFVHGCCASTVTADVFGSAVGASGGVFVVGDLTVSALPPPPPLLLLPRTPRPTRIATGKKNKTVTRVGVVSHQHVTTSRTADVSRRPGTTERSDDTRRTTPEVDLYKVKKRNVFAIQTRYPRG